MLEYIREEWARFRCNDRIWDLIVAARRRRRLGGGRTFVQTNLAPGGVVLAVEINPGCRGAAHRRLYPHRGGKAVRAGLAGTGQ